MSPKLTKKKLFLIFKKISFYSLESNNVNESGEKLWHDDMNEHSTDIHYSAPSHHLCKMSFGFKDWKYMFWNLRTKIFFFSIWGTKRSFTLNFKTKNIIKPFVYYTKINFDNENNYHKIILKETMWGS